jgi:hypothetical protein
LLLLALAVGAAACSSGGGSPAPKPAQNWDPAGLKVVQTVGTRLQGAFPGDCHDFGISGRENYVASARVVPAPLPSAVGQCTVLGETVEIAAFDTAAHRDAFVSTRGRVICQRAAAGKVALPGLRWVVGDTWSVQPDSEGVSRRLAAALGGTYRLTACSGVRHADWESAAETRADALAQRLVKAHVGCDDFALQDRDLLSTTPQFAAGLPAAYGRCTVGDDPNVDIAVFSATSLSRDKWVPLDLSVTYCRSAPKSVAILDGDWAAFATSPAVAERVRAALGGATTVRRCP